jgi:hypothetical protein
MCMRQGEEVVHVLLVEEVTHGSACCNIECHSPCKCVEEHCLSTLSVPAANTDVPTVPSRLCRCNRFVIQIRLMHAQALLRPSLSASASLEIQTCHWHIVAHLRSLCVKSATMNGSCKLITTSGDMTLNSALLQARASAASVRSSRGKTILVAESAVHG